MLVEGGYLHSLKLLMEKAAQTPDATSHAPEGAPAAPVRNSWRSGKSLLHLLIQIIDAFGHASLSDGLME